MRAWYYIPEYRNRVLERIASKYPLSETDELKKVLDASIEIMINKINEGSCGTC